MGDKKSDLKVLNRLNSERIMLEIKRHIDAGVPYIDAVVEYAEKNSLEIEVVGEIVRKSPLLKAKIYREAEELNMVEKLVRLPV
ncbi:late promoter transcription accessory protein [Porticoccaceae bacterium]|nr:late promoter transcription accessory protein [Porticoccaceae bacterium]